MGVFAPSNEAFAKLPQATLQFLLKPENKDKLDKVLEYHVVSGAVYSYDLKDDEKVKTLEGQEVQARMLQGSSDLFINNAKVLTTNVEASNGVVHIIDTVLMPPAMAQNNVMLAAATADLSTLVQAVIEGGLVDTLSGTGPFTVFAPSNEAFAKLPQATLQFLLKPENKDKLAKILTYHVVSGAVHAADLHDGEQIKTVEGQQVEAHVSEHGVAINDAKVVTKDVAASNGVVHIIDTVLMPPAAADVLV